MSSTRQSATDTQSGIVLVTCLVLLAVVMILGAAAASIATQSERGARSERDRQLAFQSAEAALRDAERDIEGDGDPQRSRGALFVQPQLATFVDGCSSGDSHPFQGLCRASTANPAWFGVDLVDNSIDSAPAVAYGRFTGQRLMTGSAALPARPPRYIIEALPFRLGGAAADAGSSSWMFRITAIGFGTNAATQVVLQSIYRRQPER